MPGMAEMLLPPIKGRTHRIEAEVDTSGGGDGVILAAGGEEAGISLFVKNGYLTYVKNDLGRAIYRLVEARTLTLGRASRGDRVGKCGEISVGAVQLKKKI